MFGQYISLIGMVCLLLAYFQLARGKWTTASNMFHGLNLTGCLLINLSMIFLEFNVGVFLLESVFIVIAICALRKNFKLKQKRS